MLETINQHKNTTVALLLFLLLVSVYCLTYSGTYIADDEHILASRSLSLGFDGYLNNNRVYGNSRIYAFSILPTEYSSPAVNVEPVQAFLGAILVRLAANLNVGRVQTLYLSNIFIVASSAVFLFLSTIFLGYSKKTAFIAGLMFGLCTIVWPYTKTYFRDPLAMMFISLAWTLLLFLKSTGKNKLVNIFTWLGLFVSVLAGILTKNTVTLVIPVLIVYQISNYSDQISLSRIHTLIFENWKKTVLVSMVLLIIFICWLIFVPADGIFTRISIKYYKYLIDAFRSKPHTGFFPALVGPLISPGKSIFLYSPVLILAVIGSFKRWDLAWPAWLYLSLLIIGQAIFYDDQWSGFINWGLRYLLPSLPLLMIAAIPAIDLWLGSKKGKIRLLIIGFLSFLIQIIGSLAPVRQYFLDILAADPELLGAETIWTFSQSAIPWHISWLLGGNWLDLASARMGVLSLPVVLISIILIVLVLYSLIFSMNRWFPIIPLILSSILLISMLLVYKHDPIFYSTREDFTSAQEKITSSILPDDVVIIRSYNTPTWNYWMNWAEPNIEWISLSSYFPEPSQVQAFERTRNPEVAMEESTINLFRGLLDENKRAWIVLPQDTPGATMHLEENWLSQHYELSDLTVFSDNQNETYLYLYDLSPPK